MRCIVSRKAGCGSDRSNRSRGRRGRHGSGCTDRLPARQAGAPNRIPAAGSGKAPDVTTTRRNPAAETYLGRLRAGTAPTDHPTGPTQQLAEGPSTHGRAADKSPTTMVAQRHQRPESVNRQAAPTGPSMTDEPGPNGTPAPNQWVRSVTAAQPSGSATQSRPGNRAGRAETGGSQLWRSAGPAWTNGQHVPWPVRAPEPATGSPSPHGTSESVYRTLVWLSLMLVALTVLLLSFALWHRPVSYPDGVAQVVVSRVESP